MAVTLIRGGVEQSLQDWHIETESAVLTLRSFSADEFSFSVAVQDAFSVPAFDDGDEIALRKDGVIIFSGSIRRRPVFGGSAERQRYTAANFWYDLDQLVYEQNRYIIDEDFADLNLVATTQIVFGLDIATGAKLDTKQEMQNLITFANLNYVPLAYDFAFDGLTAPWEQANDVTVGAGIRRMASWQPDLMARAEYSTTPPSLRLRRGATADTKLVDLTAAELLLSVECERRDDIVPAGVVFNFITSGEDADGVAYARVTVQSVGSLVGPGVIKATMPIAAGETIPPFLAFNYYTALATPYLEGRLTLKAADIATDYLPGDVLGFSNGAAHWAGAYAPVTEVQHQLGSGVTVVQFGPPSFLVPSFAGMNRRAKDSRQPPPTPPSDPGDPTTPGDATTGKTPRTGGPTGGGSQAIPYCEGGVQKTANVRLS